MMDIAAQARIDNLIWSFFTAVFIVVGSILVGYIARWVSARIGLSVREQNKVFWGFMFASPWLIGFVIFVVGPALASLYYSFTNYELGKDMKWVGLENYRDMLTGAGAHGRRFTQAMYNSFYYAIIGVPLQIATALAMAMLLNIQQRGIRVFRLIFYLPVILAGGPAILLAWRYMLASNGGFINESMNAAANSFFLFDWLKRAFIFSMETFNGFYAGIIRGDPIGPLKFVLPALLGTVLLFTLIRGEWDVSKRNRAWRAAEILGVVLAVALLGAALSVEPFDPALIYGVGLLVLAGILVSVAMNDFKTLKLWQVISLLLLAVFAALFALVDFVEEADKTPYFIAFGVAALPVVISLVGGWTRAKFNLLLIVALAFVGGLLLHLMQGQFDQGQLSVIPQYLTLQSNVAQFDNLDHLTKSYPQASLNPLWVWGFITVVLGALAFLNNRWPRTLRAVMIVVFIALLLFTVSAFVDTLRYFNAFESISTQTGTPNYHFALFRQSASQWPDANRVPLWLSSELWSKPSLILITMWSSGAGMLIFLAALKGIPQVFYEAADVDGANRMQKFFKITLPMISPAMFYNIVIGVIAALQTFESVYIIQNTQTQDSLQSAAYFLYVRTFRQLEIGEGAAVSWILAVIIIILTAIQFRYSKWVNYDV